MTRPKRLGYALLALGVFFLLTGNTLLAALPALIWVSLTLVVGAAFWLGAVPSLPPWQRVAGFIGIGVVAVVTSGRFAATAALGFPALAFGLSYLYGPKEGSFNKDRARRWWLLLPAGLLGSLTLLVTFEGLFPRWDATPLLFLGFAATFTLLYLLSPRRGGKRWALYPAILCIVLTVLSNDPSGGTPGWFVPLLLIGGGGFLLWWWNR